MQQAVHSKSTANGFGRRRGEREGGGAREEEGPEE